jgi:hypothetical protein
LLDLPATPGSEHVGGALIIGPDNNVYLVVAMVMAVLVVPIVVRKVTSKVLS